MLKTRHALPAVAAAGLLVAGLAGCGDDGDGADGGDADVFSLEVGDCIAEGSSAQEIDTVPVVDCAEPHEQEVYFSYDIPEDDMPSEAELQAIAEEQCFDAFESFIGEPYETSELDFGSMYPTADSWDDGDREVLCLVYEVSGGEVEGSLEGSNR